MVKFKSKLNIGQMFKRMWRMMQSVEPTKNKAAATGKRQQVFHKNISWFSRWVEVCSKGKMLNLTHYSYRLVPNGVFLPTAWIDSLSSSSELYMTLQAKEDTNFVTLSGTLITEAQHVVNGELWAPQRSLMLKHCSEGLLVQDDAFSISGGLEDFTWFEETHIHLLTYWNIQVLDMTVTGYPVHKA